MLPVCLKSAQLWLGSVPHYYHWESIRCLMVDGQWIETIAQAESEQLATCWACNFLGWKVSELRSASKVNHVPLGIPSVIRSSLTARSAVRWFGSSRASGSLKSQASDRDGEAWWRAGGHLAEFRHQRDSGESPRIPASQRFCTRHSPFKTALPLFWGITAGH